jgi:hypothetical protein
VLGSVHAHAAGMSIIDAQDYFRRARRAHAAARLWRHVSRRDRSPNRPRVLCDVSGLPAGPRRVEVVPLRSIIGTFALTVEFDGEFRPASERMRRRWERVALAHRQGVALPPIVVGRHRVSVARALGHSDIDAWVSGPTGGLGGSASIDTALAA